MLIATRILTLDSEGIKSDIPVRLFAPVLQGTDWMCSYEIDWPETKRLGYAAGLDSMQAIHLALQKIGIDIYMSHYHTMRCIYWQMPGAGYGFPVPKNGRDFLIGDDKMYES